MSDHVPVFFDHLHIGDVGVAGDGALSFAYTRKWLATQGAFPISVTLPLSEETYETETISPWLANLLPEEEQLTVLTRSLGLDRSDTLALLREIGGDTAGALSFAEPSKREAWNYTPLAEFYEASSEEEALEKHFRDLSTRPFLAGEDGIRLSLAGGQKKTALAVTDAEGQPALRLPGEGDQIVVPRDGAPSTVIIKPDNQLLPGIVENETYCLKLARAIGINAADVSILKAGARSAICVLRYDRTLSRKGDLQRLHQEDFAQANSVPPGRKYERGTVAGPTIETLLSTAKHVPPSDELALIDQLIFNILVANTDAHAKNYSLLFPIGKGPQLAPLYDVSSVLGWSHVVQYYAQNIAGRKRKPVDTAPAHWDAISAAGRLRASNVRARVEELVDLIVAHRVEVTKQVKSFAGASPGYVDQTAEQIEENALRIAGRIRAARRQSVA